MEINFRTNIKSFLDQLTTLSPITTETAASFSKDKRVKAVIFDIYGTLLISSSGDIDQTSLKTENISKALDAGGFVISDNETNETVCNFFLEKLPTTVKRHQLELIANGHPFPDVDIIAVWTEIVNEASKRGYLKESDSSVVDLIMVFELLSNSVYPMPEMKEVLTLLQEKKIPIGIVSNAQFYTPIIMNYFLNGDLSTSEDIIGFEPELSVYSYKELRAKPDYTIFERFLPALKTKYSIEPNEAIFVGNDMLKDVYTANKAGLKTVLFAGDERSLRLRADDKRTATLKPDYIITELMQLKEIID